MVLWVTITIVWPRSSTAWRMNRKTSLPDRESRFPVGSSAKMISGLLANALDTATRCCWPTGQLVGPVVQTVAQTHRGDHPVHPLLVGPAPSQVNGQSDVLDGGQRGNQVVGLEDEPHPVAAQPGQFFVGESAQIGATDEGPALGEIVKSGHAVQQR